MTDGNYQVVISRRVGKQLQRLNRSDQRRIGAALDLLGYDPRPPRCRPITGIDDTYRVRVGDYRIVYSIHDDVRIVAIIRVGHRRDVYRD